MEDSSGRKRRVKRRTVGSVNVAQWPPTGGRHDDLQGQMSFVGQEAKTVITIKSSCETKVCQPQSNMVTLATKMTSFLTTWFAELLHNGEHSHLQRTYLTTWLCTDVQCNYVSIYNISTYNVTMCLPTTCLPTTYLLRTYLQSMYARMCVPMLEVRTYLGCAGV